MDREGGVFHLDANDLAEIEAHKDDVEEDQYLTEEEATAMIRFHQDGVDQTYGVPTTSREVVTTNTSPDGAVATQQGGGPPPYHDPSLPLMVNGNAIYPSLTEESTLRASNV